MLTDRYGLSLSTSSSRAREAYVEGCEALASTVFAQRKAGWRAALRSEPVTWRSWAIPGCSAMQRNHWPPSLTTVVPASILEHRRLVSPARKPRTTCKRACSGRPSLEVSIATIKGCGRDGRARTLRRCARRRCKRRRSRSAGQRRRACNDGRARAWLASACAEVARQRWSRSQAVGPTRCWIFPS